MKENYLFLFLNLLFVLALSLTCSAQTPSSSDRPARFSEGSLVEIKGKPHAQLIVIRSEVIDASGNSALSAIDAVRAGTTTDHRYAYVFSVIAKRLNKYIRKYRTVSAVTNASQADFFVVFNLLGYRHVLYNYYPYGEMFVVTNSSDDIRLLWKTPKAMNADDAANRLIDALKVVNDQK